MVDPRQLDDLQYKIDQVQHQLEILLAELQIIQANCEHDFNEGVCQKCGFTISSGHG